MPPPPQVRVAVLHSSPLVRDGLVLALRRAPGVRNVLTVVLDEQAQDGWACFDVLLVELRRGDDPFRQRLSVSGLPARLRLVGLHTGLRLEDARRALDLGFRSLVHDKAGLAGVLEALAPATWASASVSGPPAELPRLEPVERRVLRALSLGGTSRRAAGDLGLTPGQFDDVKQRVFLKLGVGHQAHAVAAALRLGLLDEPVDDWREGVPAGTPA